jgi:hypothetical protein
MEDQDLKKLIEDFSNTYEKSVKNLMDFLRGANAMVAWLVTLTSASIVFGYSNIWSKDPKLLFIASIIHGCQILCAILHRIYNDSFISSMNERIDFTNLQKIYLQNNLDAIRKFPSDKIYFEIYNKIGNLHYLRDIEMTGVDKMDRSLKITKVIYAPCGVLVIICSIAIYSIFIYLSVR